MDILKALIAVLVLAAPCSYTDLRLIESEKRMMWHLLSLALTLGLFLALATTANSRMDYQQLVIIGLPTFLVMLFSTSLVRSQQINNGE